MRILITGAAGFVGKNLVAALENIMTGKDRTHPALVIDGVDRYDADTDPALLPLFCARADFVVHLAGVNRPQDSADYMRGNVGFTERLLETLTKEGNTCPVLFASSAQATLLGRYVGSPYGESKRACEALLRAYADESGARVLIYRFPNLFGKWCRPNYNSAVATFCYNTANDLPLSVSDPALELELVYIDDLIEEILAALCGGEHRCHYDGLIPVPDVDGAFCYVPERHRTTLGEIAELLASFHQRYATPFVPQMPAGSFVKKLYATYLSYLPADKAVHALCLHTDGRGSFAEILRTADCGQFSVNITGPGVTKGEHWHSTKWELFVVVSGEGIIRQRRLDGDEVLEFRVSGRKPQAVYILPGYTHSITNLSEKEELITLMWASECFDPARPDTFREEVES